MKIANTIITMAHHHFLLPLLISTNLFLSSCATAPDSPYYQQSPNAYNFDYHSDATFAKYLADTRAYLKANRVFFDVANQERELDMVAPFEWQPDASCNTNTKRGILMIHGLSDTTYVMQDLAKALQKQCFLVRTLLLPGHGTRPKDLIDIEYTDWIDAVNYGVRSLQQNVDQSYIAGFSLGGLLAANALLDHPDLQGGILIAPALGINRPLLTWNTTWLRHVKDWLDIDPPTQAPRYQSMVTNGIAQTYLLSRYFNQRLEQKGSQTIKTPVFLMQSMEDIAIQPPLNIDLFKQHMTHPNSQALIYASGATPVAPFPQLTLVSSHLPQQKIANFSHIAIPYAPNNPLYGANGLYRECGENVGLISEQQANDCLNSDDNWLGEFDSVAVENFYPFQRLTFNPFFNEMVEQINSYLHTTSNP